MSRKRRPKTEDQRPRKGSPLENEDLEKEDPLENEDLENENPLENEDLEKEEPLENEDLENEYPLEYEDLENEDPLENEDLENEDPLEKHENTKQKIEAESSLEAPLGGLWVSRIPLIFDQNIPYPVNSRSLYPYNASYYWWRHVICLGTR